MSTQALSTKQIEAYQRRLETGGISAVSGIYKDLQSKGYTYAGWANGVATGNTITGQAALDFMGHTVRQDGKSLTKTDIDQVRVDMQAGYLKALLQKANNNGTVDSDVDFKTTRDFHAAAFEKNNLSIDNWTLETPMALIGKYQGKEFQEMLWKAIRDTEGDYFDAATSSYTLQEMTREYATGQLYVDKETGLYVPYGTAQLNPEKVEKVDVDPQDKQLADAWLDHARVTMSVGKWAAYNHPYAQLFRDIFSANDRARATRDIEEFFNRYRDMPYRLKNPLFEHFKKLMEGLLGLRLDWLPDTFGDWRNLNRSGFHYFYDPLVLDLNGNGRIDTLGVDINNRSNNAFFDFDGDNSQGMMALAA